VRCYTGDRSACSGNIGRTQTGLYVCCWLSADCKGEDGAWGIMQEIPRGVIWSEHSACIYVTDRRSTWYFAGWMSITAPFSGLFQPSTTADFMLVQDLSYGLLRTPALNVWCRSYGIHEKRQCLAKHIFTKFMCVSLLLRTFGRINSLMNVGTLCLVMFLTLQRL
jgi:hypothetical protein